MSVCPVCGSGGGMLLYSVNSAVAARALAVGLEKPQFIEVQRSIERIWDRQSADFLLCDECGFGFADPHVAATPEFYAQLYSTTTAYSESKWEFERTIVALGELIGKWNSGFTIVDIGAGAGAFASRVSETFPDVATILCTEYSESGGTSIQQRGLTCVTGGLMDLDEHTYAHGFDVLCLFQVLEHVDDPHPAFDRLSALATDRAHLFLAVPNDRQRAYFDALGFHEDMPPVHVGRWSRRSLELVAEKHGWKLEEDAVEPQPFFSKLQCLATQFYLADPGVERLGAVRKRFIRRVLRGGLIAMFLLRSARAVLGLASRDLGTAYWAHLSRE